MEIDFTMFLIMVIHKRSFKTSNTYLFACLIFYLCRDVGVPVWHCDTFRTLVGRVEVGLIRDEANVAPPRRGPTVEI